MEQYINKIINADCMDILKQLPDKSVDLVLTDPPYGTTVCKWDKIIPMEILWAEFKRIIKENGCVVICGAEPFSSMVRTSNLKMYRYDWIWDKGTHSNPLLAKKQPLRVYENICVFYKKQPTYNPQMIQGKPYKKDYGYKKHHTETLGSIILFDNNNLTGKRYPVNIIKIGQPKNNRKYNHPTQKPVALFEYMVKTYTNENDVVLDCFSGSGTTAVACRNLKRRFICIEKDPEYWEASCERLEQEQRQQTLF